MRKLVAMAIALVALSLVGAAFAGGANPPHGAHGLAAKQCAMQQRDDRAAFRAVWGDHAMKTCIGVTKGDAAADVSNAAKDCKAERQADPAAFEAAYGSGHNAFGR